MAGILGNSASKTMVGGDTAVDNAQSGYVTGEQITLSVTPTGTDYVWGQAIPSASSTARSALSSTTAASPTFAPDAAGHYTVTCVVDSTDEYVLRLSVTSTAVAQLVEAVRLSPKQDSAVPAPAVGLTQFYSDTHEQLAVKDPSDRVWPLLVGKMGPALANADATIVVGDGDRRVLPASTLSANRTVTLGTTGAAAGNAFELVRLDTTANTLAVVNGGAGAGTLLTFPVSASGYASFRFDGTNWELSERRPIS